MSSKLLSAGLLHPLLIPNAPAHIWVLTSSLTSHLHKGPKLVVQFLFTNNLCLWRTQRQFSTMCSGFNIFLLIMAASLSPECGNPSVKCFINSGYHHQASRQVVWLNFWLLCQSGASGDDIAHLQCMLRTPSRNPLLIRLHLCVCWNFSLHYFLGLVSSVITQRSTTGSIWTIFILGIGSSCPPKTSAPQVSWPLKSFTTIPFCELSTLIDTFIGILWVMGPWCVELLVRGGFREP